ncbi:MAG: 50S ribosomal protein L5 [Thermoprotei archaeon]
MSGEVAQPVVKQNPMREIFIEKVVVNIGVGEAGERVKKAAMVLERITGVKPVYTSAHRSIREFSVRRGEEIGCKVTLRGSSAEAFLKKAFEAVGNNLKRSSIDNMGNFSFGITEHIFIPGTKYDPELGIFGIDVCVRLARRGIRVSLRKLRPNRVGKSHIVGAEEAARYVSEKFGVKVV